MNSQTSNKLKSILPNRDKTGYTHLLVKNKDGSISKQRKSAPAIFTSSRSDVISQPIATESSTDKTVCSDLKQDSKCYKPTKGLEAGGGSTGIDVVDYICDTSHRQLVLKQIKTSSSVKLQQAIDIHKSLKHPNIIELCFMFEEGNKMYSVMEYVDGENLFDFREDLLETGLNISPIIFFHILYEVSKGMEYIYDHNIIHRDIKPENIVVSSDLSEVKIIDFDFSVIDNGQIKIDKGTMAYRPTNEDINTVTNKSYDMWSLGATMYYIAGGMDLKDVLYHIARKPYTKNHAYYDLPFTDKYIDAAMQRFIKDPSISDILFRMLTLDKSKRITPKALVKYSKKTLDSIIASTSPQKLQDLELMFGYTFFKQ